MRLPALRPSLIATTLAALLALLAAGRPAQAQDPSEYNLKAVLFVRLAQFIYWPAEKSVSPPLKLCVVGRNPFGNALSQADQSSQGIETVLSPADLGVCHLLFIPRSESASLNQWLERSSQRTLVTVSDIPGFARSGGMIELPLEGERIAIVINRRSAQKKAIEFNAQLLRLARVID